MAKLLIQGTHGREDAEKATLPFIVGNVAASADQEVVVLLTSEAVWIATRGYADDIQKEGFPPLAQVMREFVANGGQIWACAACTKPRGITEEQLVEGAKILGAPRVVEYLAQGGVSTLSF